MIKFLLVAIALFPLLVIFVHKDYLFNYGKVSSGQNWEAKQYGNTYVIKIQNHSEVVGAFEDFVEKEKITAGTISGLGAVNSATLRSFNPATKQYLNKTFDEQMEISNLVGNISTQNGKPHVHIHATFGTTNYNAYAGHLLSAKINGAGEFVVVKILRGKVERVQDFETGLYVYGFKK